MTGTRTRTALVIGGGIAGPATAMALQHAGIEATVYESHAAGAEGIGAFLTLASNGIDALRAWHSGRMIVIGDAAHAPSPSSGQGASLSIEDAVVLAKSLRDLSTPQAAFARFEAARRPRVERIIKWAARINNSKAAGPVARMLRDAMLPMILTMTADSKALRQTYDYHIDWDTHTHTPAAA